MTVTRNGAPRGTEGSYDAFISFAGEDREFAATLAARLAGNGLGVWFADFELRPGDRILERIHEGLSRSRTGILIVSQAFLDKPGPRYETEILMTAFIESGMRLLPVWHGVEEDEVRQKHPGLAGVWGVHSTSELDSVVLELTQAIVEGARTVGVFHGYAMPDFRFLTGLGEIALGKDGPATSIWEALVYMKDEEYPLWIGGRVYSREDLLFHACQNLSARRVKPPDFLETAVYCLVSSPCAGTLVSIRNMFG
jgi:hypothetical protein